MVLSIIIPVYNLEKYIAKTLNSIFEIEFPFEYEIIVVNDGSTDKSANIISKYMEIYNNLRIVNVENGGVSNARNIGIQKAVGKYITFVDGDDIIYPDFFTYAVMEAEDNGYDFVQGNYLLANDVKMQPEQTVKKSIVLTDTIDMVKGLLSPQKIIFNSVWGKVYRKSTIEKIMFDTSLKVAEDQKFIFDTIQKAKKILLSNQLAYIYYQRDGSAMHNKSQEKEKDKLYALSYYKAIVNDPLVVKYIKRHEMLSLLDLYMIENNRKIKKTYFKEMKKLKVQSFFNLLDQKTKLKIVYIYLLNFFLS